MVEAARPSWAAIARRLSPSAFSTASRSLSSRRRCVPPDIAPSRIAVPGQSVTTTPRDVALHAGLRRVQTDRGGEFFAYEVQNDLREQQIKFRPNRPRAPHLNGKVERVQRTALEEFWPTVDPKDPDLAAQLEQWRSFFNNHSPPNSPLGRTT